MRNTFTPSLFSSRNLLSALLCVSVITGALAQAKLSNSTPLVIDFSNTTPASVGTNPTSNFTGVGFSPDPVVAGRLNSNAWSVNGWSDGNLAFGGTNTAGDYARGATAVAVITGGMYAFTGAPHSAANPALMFQPGGSDFAPGNIILRVQNTGATNITQLAVSYNLYVRNDQGRGNSFNFSHSADNVTYTTVPALDYTSIQAADALGWVLVGNKSTTITGLNIAPNAFYYIRWNSADVNGSGSRDEFGLDDISLTATFACSLNSADLTNVHCEDNNNTGNNNADDYIWFKLQPTGSNLGSGYNVTVSSGSVLWNGNTAATNVPYGNAENFRLQAGSAGGGNVTVTVTDASGNCSVMVLVTDPGSCSVPACSFTSAGLTDVHCEDNNETGDNATDDYIWLQLQPTGSNLGSGYSVTVSSGSILWNGNTAATNVPYANSEYFRLQAGSAGAGNVTLTITDASGNCTIMVLVTDPGSCSTPICNISDGGLASVTCNNNGTNATPADDYITFSLIPTGVGLSTYSLTVSSGSVTKLDGSPATGIAYNVTTNFRLQNGSAGGGNVIVFITDDNDPDCVLAVDITDPGSCSVVNCDINIDYLQVFDETCPGENDGYIMAAVFCNTCTSVEYSLDGITWQSSSEFFNLAPGTYTVYVRDTGNNSCTTSKVGVVGPGDNIPPHFDQNPLPQNQTYQCNQTVPAPDVLTATDDDGESPADVTFGSVTTPGTCPQEYTLTRTWTATDECGNTVTHTQVITVEDNTPPTLQNLPNPTASIECSDPLPPVPNVTATDLCDPSVPVVFSTTTIPGSCPQSYVLRRTWTATDDCGNSTSFSQNITVADHTAPVFNNPNSLPANITVSCSNIPDPPVLTGTDNCDPGVPVPVIFINEIHYDNTGTDVGEFIEIAGTAGINLANYQLVLYNGTGGAPYSTVVLSGVIDNEAGGFGAVSFGYPANGIQNGAPDGVALATTGGTVIQFLSYEGVFTAVGGVANGLLSTDIGVQELGTEPVGLSLQLTGTGQVYNNFTWVGPIAASPGTLNAGQTLQALPGVITAVFSQSVTPGGCNGESTITRMWQLKDACNNSVTHTQVITVVDTQGPAFSPPPLPTDMTLSCEQPVPPAPVLTAADLCDVPGAISERVWINEIHYDNVGTDSGEFIEVAGSAGTNLANYSLVLYNGGDGLSYNTTVLSGIIPNQANGFGTVCFNYAVNGIQNGAPDGVALVHTSMGNMVVQFLSYEGTFTATNGPANGMLSTDIGVDEDPAPAVGQSVYLTGSGDEYSDFTWTGPAAATNCGVNTGQTFVAMSNGPIVTFTETTENGACPQERKIHRTWTATDDCGNTTVLNQTITIVDHTPPTVNCPANLTLNLDIFGNASLAIGDISFTYSDNCAPQNSLVVMPFATQHYDCDDEGKTYQVTISVKDPCGNIGSCTINVFISPFSRCTPIILITDPCICKNNASTLTDGQFGEKIKIESLAGLVWTVIDNSGFYSENSPAPPGSPILVPVGAVFTEIPVGSGDYYLSGLHIDAIGYSITVRNQNGQTLSIGNKCEYPNPTITSDLSGPFCLYSDPVNLTGTPGDAHIVSQGFTINGLPATVFDPSQGVGQYKIVYTVDGGVPKAFGPTDPGCVQTVTKFVNVLATPSNLVCNDLVYISLDQVTCAQDLLPDMILEGSYLCYDDYIVELDKTVPYGNGPWVPGHVDANDIGHTYQVRVTHLVSGNKCWGNIKVEDKQPPVLTCSNFSVPCNTPDLSANYLFSTLHINAANPVVTDCQNFTLTYIDSQVSKDCASGLTKIITRKWTAVDASGNSATCEQTIGLTRPTLADVTLPPDYDGIDAPGFNCTASYPTPDWIESQGLQGYPHVFGQPDGCNINWEFHDFLLPICDGTYKIRREWSIIDWCTGSLKTLNQLIKVEDKTGPQMTCPANTTVSIDPFQCCGTIDMPNLIIQDQCSRVNNIGGMVVTFDPFTNQQTGMYQFSGTLKDFPGNNWWNPDTLADFGVTPCLPIGTQTVTYFATDACGNSTTCSFKLAIQDLIPPVAACDQVTTVALTADGTAEVLASTFDDGSYDACAQVHFKARRMNSSSCQSNGQFHDEVRFCCGDVGKTIQVVFRVYDVAVNAGDVSTSFQEEHSNDCMVSVEVQDKIKPSCIPPVNVTVDCENFDPTLWAYGIAEVDDNCCLDDTKEYQGQEGLTHTVNYSLFDTVCNKGTIVRTFRAYDCHGQTSQCTQRVVVNYLQDYYIKFPNDAIVTVCDGTGNFGEPLFYGEDCELLGVSYEDEIFTVVPDACFKIERNWTIINWCTYNPNGACIYVPNPNPNPIVNHPSNLAGPTVSACGTIAPWAPTNVKINPSDPQPTNFCTYWKADANCYKYKQIIKIIDGQAPQIDHCPSDTIYCDLTANDAGLWNHPDWWDNTAQSHNLCEGPTDMTIVAKDACSNVNVTARYLLFLDLDNDGTMETVVNSINPPPPGIVYYNNVNTPNYSGGTPRAFDNRGLPTNQNYKFAVLERFNSTGTKKLFSLRWNTQQFPNVYTVPEFPHGTHKIKWYVADGCGNESSCEYNFTVKDCKAPTVVCHNGLSVNLMPSGMITLWASDFLQYTEDNCTPSGQLKLGIRKCGAGTGFPVDANGNPITSVTFNCTELGTQCVELWAIDAAGNADYCQTFVLIQDNLGNCAPDNHINVSGAVVTEMSSGIEEATVHINGTSSFAPPYSYYDLSDADGTYQVMNNVPLDATFIIVPEKNDNPLNGVTTYDLTLISKHILSIEPLDSPYKIIAADANKSNSVTSFDIVELRKLILGIYTELPNNTSWRFVDHSFAFPNPQNPFATPFPENISVANAMSNMFGEDFMGIKVGDLNNSCVPNVNAQSEERSLGTSYFDLEDRALKAGETFEVNFKAAEMLLGYQFTLALKGLEMTGLQETENVNTNNFGNFGSTVTVSIDGASAFTLRFKALKDGRLSEMLGISGAITRAETYFADGLGVVAKHTPALRFNGQTISGLGFELYQNEPNPFVNRTSIGFYLPEAAEATLTVIDETGRMVYRQKGQFAQGKNSISLDRALLNTSGVLYYKLETANNSATMKMIQTR